MTRARIPSRTAFETAWEYIRSTGLDDRGFSVSLDGTITVHPAHKQPVSSDYDKWKRQEGAR